ncbi:replication protein A 70 kDa DNA-binding subunit E-like [Cryptomeria japonica]|uniref:replication protein A 70 kDa DNA-binding subunit E-like n=1 Tax=Cryptomeria japonica TaxID=3369 RepID=UPI0027DA602A|nr:replication protein A 70 kDa DNA-binding subunit E-like [Cryptomeria japonica]
MATLIANAIPDILAGMSLVDPSLQVTAIHSIQQPHSTNVKYRLKLSDGMHTHPTLLPNQMNSLVLEEALVTGSILCLTEYSCKIFDKYTAIIILSFDIISNNAAIIGSPTPLLQAIAYLPSNSSEDPLNPFPIIPIKTLTPYHKQWSIQGRALAKTPIHNFKNVGCDGKVFGFDFVDMLGSEIHVTCFNELVDNFYHVIHSGSLYVISNGRIKVANTKYSSSTNPFEIILHDSSIVTPTTCIDSTIPKHSFHIKSIDSLQSFPINALVDVIGIVLSISPTSTIRKRDGTETIKCTATIIDMSSCTIDITFWGRHCQIEGKQIFEMSLEPNPPVLLIKSGRIVSWNGKSLDTIFSTTLLINPDLLETTTLQTWYAKKGVDEPYISLSQTNLSPHTFENPIDISSITDESFPGQKNVCVKATITKLHLDNFYYLSCPQVVNKKKCKKKVVQSSPNTFQCPKCSTDLSECDFSYMLKMDLQDETGELLKVTAFEGPSNTLLGVPAEDFQLLLAEPNAVEPSNVIDCKFFFDLNIKMVPFAGQETQSIVITAIKPT